MARKKIKSGIGATPDQLRVELIPASIDKNEDILRIQEIRHLVTKVVLLGKKRGRPSMKPEEVDNAA